MKERTVGALAFATIVAIAFFSMPTLQFGTPSADAQGWSSKQTLKGNAFKGDFTGAVNDTMLRWHANADSQGFTADPSTFPSQTLRWWFISISDACSLDIYSHSCLAESGKVVVPSHQATGAVDILLPGFEKGIDSVRVRVAGAGTVTLSAWGMN